jgi:hypothetical protein
MSFRDGSIMFSREDCPSWPFCTPEQKREYAEGLKAVWPDVYEEWNAMADLQEAGLLEDWRAALSEWKQAKPTARRFLREVSGNE